MQINIPAILIANGMGLAILFVVAVGDKWRFMDALKENKFISIIAVASAVNCIVDPLCFLADGRPGPFNRFLVIACNSILYLCGITIACIWVYLVSSHINAKLHWVHQLFLNIVPIAAAVLLIVNLFIPVLFTVSEDNVYARAPGYWLHTAAYIGFMLDGLVIYLVNKRESGGLKFFPVWAFLLPAAVGLAVQTAFYGVSTAAPLVTVSVVGVLLCLQNEFILRDKLTGLYNRFYLNAVEKILTKNPKLQYSAIMLDINEFKQINDTHGHRMGDDALINMASVLTSAAGRIGEVIRYAGDEFIIILNTHDEQVVQDVISNVHAMLDDFNSKNSEYKLLVSTGYIAINLKEANMDEFIDKVDKLMYQSKGEYYKDSAAAPPIK